MISSYYVKIYLAGSPAFIEEGDDFDVELCVWSHRVSIIPSLVITKKQEILNMPKIGIQPWTKVVSWSVYTPWPNH